MAPSDWINLASAIATVSATLLALYLAFRGNSRHIDGTFLWETATNYQPILLVQNTSSRIVVLDSIEIKYHGKRAGIISASVDSTLAQHAIIEAGQIKRIPIDTKYLNVEEQSDQAKRHCLKVIIKLRNGRKYKSKQKYSYDEVSILFFVQGFYSEN